MPKSSLYIIICQLFYIAKFKTSSYNNCVSQRGPQGFLNVFIETQLKQILLNNIMCYKVQNIDIKRQFCMNVHI